MISEGICEVVKEASLAKGQVKWFLRNDHCISSRAVKTVWLKSRLWFKHMLNSLDNSKIVWSAYIGLQNCHLGDKTISRMSSDLDNLKIHA